MARASGSRVAWLGFGFGFRFFLTAKVRRLFRKIKKIRIDDSRKVIN